MTKAVINGVCKLCMGCGILYTDLSTDSVYMFEYEPYVHDVNNMQLLTAYLYRVALRIEMVKVHHDID